MFSFKNFRISPLWRWKCCMKTPTYSSWKDRIKISLITYFDTLPIVVLIVLIKLGFWILEKCLKPCLAMDWFKRLVVSVYLTTFKTIGWAISMAPHLGKVHVCFCGLRSNVCFHFITCYEYFLKSVLWSVKWACLTIFAVHTSRKRARLGLDQGNKENKRQHSCCLPFMLDQ